MTILDHMEVVAAVEEVVDPLHTEVVLAMEDQVEIEEEDLVITLEAETGFPKEEVAVVAAVPEAMIVSSWKTVFSFRACLST